MRQRVRFVIGGMVAASVFLVATQCDFGIPTSLQPAPHHECFRIADPYAVPGGMWHRGNFHMHTNHSDGALSGEETVQLYQSHGYTVLCLSDHNQYGDQDGGVDSTYQLDAEPHDWNGDGKVHAERVFGSGVEAYVRDFSKPPHPWSRDAWSRSDELRWDAAPILIPGAEISHDGLHFGIVGLPGGAVEPPNSPPTYFDRADQAGGFVFLAHPGEWNTVPDQLAHAIPLARFDGIEILNGLRLTKRGIGKTGGADGTTGEEPPEATLLWDGLLARGHRLWGLANDDAHTWPGEPEAYPFTAFDMLLVAEPSRDGFLHALHTGAFYASTGLFFLDLRVKEGAIEVVAPEAIELRFIGWGGRVLQETMGSEAEYRPVGDEGYVRVEAIGPVAGDDRPWPRRAWSQPFFLEAAPCPPPADGGSN